MRRLSAKQIKASRREYLRDIDAQLEREEALRDDVEEFVDCIPSSHSHEVLLTLLQAAAVYNLRKTSPMNVRNGVRSRRR